MCSKAVPSKGLDLAWCIKGLTVISLALMMYPLLSHPAPRYMAAPDVAAHYGYASAISKGIENVGSSYPKLFHIATAFISNISGISLGSAMYLIIFLSAIFLPYITFKLAFLLTKHREISLLSSFFSVVTVVYTPGNFGITMPVAQSIAMSLLPLVLYLFISGRKVLSGVTLAVYMATHPSWPLAVILLVIYVLIDYMENKKAQVFLPLFLVLSESMLIYLPYIFFVNSHVAFRIIALSAYSGISIFSLFWLIWPPGLFILIIYSMWRIIVKKADYNKNYKFAAVSFLLIALSTQAYLIGLAGPFVKVMFAENIIILHERFLTFGLFFISMLSAYALYHLTNGKGHHILAVCLIVLIASVPYYWNRFDKQSVRFTDSELEVIDAFHSMNVYYKNVLYNPLYPKPTGSMVGMGGQVAVYTEDAYLAIKEYRTFNPISVTYALAARNDSEMARFVSSHPGALKEIYSNEDYLLYEFTEKLGNSNMSLLDSLDIYSGYYNSYIGPKYVKDALRKPARIMLHNKESNQTVCVQMYSNMTIVPCGGAYDLLVEGDAKVFNYLFTNSFGVIPFVTNSLYLYNNGFISITPGESMNVSVDIPNKLHRPVAMRLFLYDVGVYVDIHADEKNAVIELTKQASLPATKLSLRFFARTLAWVDPQPKYSYTYPNIILSLPYAALTEVIDRIRGSP